MEHSQEPTISVCASVDTEEKRIDEFLSSLIEFADEIIISDTGSLDNTVQIVEHHRKTNPKIFLYHYVSPGAFHFGLAKNFAMSKASKDYILVLDADERLSPEFKKNIRPFLKAHAPNAVAIVRCDDLLTTLEEPIERIAKRGSGVLHGTDDASKVHEHFVHTFPVLTFPYPVWHCQREKHWLLRPHSRFFYLALEIDRTPKTKSFFGHFLRGIWMFQYKFRRVYFAQRMNQEGLMGLRYSILRATYAFLIQFFVGLKRESDIYWTTDTYKKRMQNKVISDFK